KVTAFQEAKVLKDVTLESLISSLRSHEMELQADEPDKRTKSVALSSTKDVEDESDEEMALMTRRYQ
ncbi:hypothetical protein A2U01_0075750, partial [Trifolium medium]|nr:hypothetical protein [Trifolium medium]